MVIQQFNKLIRNKWVWGAFAVVVSAAFCFDDMFRGGGSGEIDNNCGTIGGKPFDADLFRTAVKVNRGLESMAIDRGSRVKPVSAYEMNHRVWVSYALAETAQANGIAVSDKELSASIVNQFGANSFDSARYREILTQSLGVTVKDYERVMRRNLEGSYAANSLLSAVVWGSPMETELALADKTDKFTVRVAEFAQTKEEADAVKMDEAALKQWYDENSAKLALPELVKIRYVAFDATATNVQARMTVTEDDLRDLYDVSLQKYTSVDTNGVETVKKFEEVRDEIEKDLRLKLALDFFVTNLNDRAFAGLADGVAAASRVDKIAKEEGQPVKESDWFSAGDDFFMLEGFAVHPGMVLPGVKYNDLIAAVRQLDPSSDFERYSVVASDRMVYLLERSQRAPAHTPSFDEAKGKIGKRALADAKTARFKAKVEEVTLKGFDAVLAASGNATNITFTADTAPGSFPNQYKVVEAAKKLKKGEISGFIRLGADKAIVVACVDRVKDEGSLASLSADESIERVVCAKAAEQLYSLWPESNLKKLGYTTSVETVDVEPTESLVDGE